MLEENTSQAKQEIFILIAGIGSGCLFQPPMIALQTAMPLKDMAIATAAYGLVRSATLPFSLSLYFKLSYTFYAGNWGAQSVSPSATPYSLRNSASVSQRCQATLVKQGHKQ